MLECRCFFLVLALALAVRVQAADAGNKRNDALLLREPVVETSPVLAPFQHVRFCLRYPRDCQPSSTRRKPVPLQKMGLLKSVNTKVNQSINPRSKAYDGSEIWAIAPETGDCNDYAVTKRHELLARGLPSSALRLSVVVTPEGVGHLVLVVTTTVGNLVMDNLAEEIVQWQLTEYRWLKIQTKNDPQLWIGNKALLPDHDEESSTKNGPT